MSLRRKILQAWEDSPSSPAWSRVLMKSLVPWVASMAPRWRSGAGDLKRGRRVFRKFPFQSFRLETSHWGDGKNAHGRLAGGKTSLERAKARRGEQGLWRKTQGCNGCG